MKYYTFNMISARLRKSFTYLLPNNTSFLREVHVYLSPGFNFRFITTKSDSQPVANKTFSELLPGRTPESPDSVLLFLKEYGFSVTQLQKMIKSRQQFLLADLEKSIKPKFKFFQDWGLPVSDVVEIIRKEPLILCFNTSTRFIPSLTALKGLLGSNEKVVKVIKRCSWFLNLDLSKRMWPNFEFLQSCGIPTKHVIDLLIMHPRLLLLSPEKVRKHVEKVGRLMVDPNSKMYVHAFIVSCSMTDVVWELKLQALRELGFSESDALTTFKKAPYALGVSVKKLKRMTGVILATKRYTISSIIANPALLCCSIDKRIKPRLQVLESLEKRNLIKKWPSIAAVYCYTDEKFDERFVTPYPNEAGKEDSGTSDSCSGREGNFLKLA